MQYPKITHKNIVMIKHLISKFMLSIFIISIVFQNVQISSRAQEDIIQIPVIIEEKNGAYMDNSLYRRGFPLKEGQVKSLDAFALYDLNGNNIPSDFEVTEKYRDGSIKWALCSFVTDLRQDEVKEFIIKNTGKEEVKNPVEVDILHDGIVLKNNYLSVKADYNGVSNFNSKKELIKSCNMYLQLEGEKEIDFHVNDISVMKQNPLYAKVKIKGDFNGLHIGEIILTLHQNAKKVHIEYRITAKKNISIIDMGLKVKTESGASINYPQTKYSKDGVIGSDYISVSSGKDIVYLISRDTEKFRGATTYEDSTGFDIATDNIKFAPIIHGKPFFWYDGLTRTNHLYLSVEENGYSYVEALRNPPKVTISREQFVEAGMVASTSISAPLNTFMNNVECDYNQRDGVLWAGALHPSTNPSENTVSSSDRHPGELEHNYGIAYMATGDERLYNAMQESAECWADYNIYKGSIDEIYGANRYRTDAAYLGSSATTSHPYYGDTSGLYMSYVLSGNEYLKETYKIVVDFIYANMYRYKNMGQNYPRMYDWRTGVASARGYVESRYMIQARGLYYAYGLFGDEKYRDASFDIVKWADAAQTDDGYWYQAMWDNGTPLIQGGQTEPAIKDYIWMYGLRGISFLSRHEQNPEIIKVLNKASDFICDSIEKYGPGIWHPTGDKELYAFAEDGSRGKMQMCSIMSVELLYSTYKLSGNQRHLETMLKCIKSWLSAMNPDGTSMAHCGYGETSDCSIGSAQLFTVLQVCPEIGKFMKDNAELIEELGYGYLVTVFDDGTKLYDKNVTLVDIEELEVMQTIYQNGQDKVLFACKQLVMQPGELTKDYYAIIPEGGLWQGIENRVSNPSEVTLYNKLTRFEELLAQWRPIFITELTEETTAFVDKYEEQKVKVRIYGKGALKLLIKDGKFSVKNGERFSVVFRRADSSGIEISIVKNSNGNYIATDCGLEIKVEAGELLELKDCDNLSAIYSVKNGYMSAENGYFYPKEEANIEEFKANVEKITGNTVVLSANTYEAAADVVLRKLFEKNNKFFEDRNIYKFEAIANHVLSDQEAVKIGAEVLEIPKSDSLRGDIELPLVSAAGTSVSWKSSNEELIDNNGKLKKISDDSQEVVLTATVSKGTANMTREFKVKVSGRNDVCWMPRSADLITNAYQLIPQQDQFEIDLVVTLNESKTDAQIGFGDSTKSASGYSSMPMIIRFNTNGFVDAYNQNQYMAIDEVEYSQGKKFNVRTSINLLDKTYSVFVRPEEAEKEYCIAKDFSFRETAPIPDKVNVAYIVASTSKNNYTIESINCAVFEQAEKLSQVVFDENGLLFGKYAYKKIDLPYWLQNEKIIWFSSDEALADDYGTIKDGLTMKTISFFGVREEDYQDINSLEILKKLNLINDVTGASNKLTRNGAANLIRALKYLY